jgi:hypothetical protein
MSTITKTPMPAGEWLALYIETLILASRAVVAHALGARVISAASGGVGVDVQFPPLSALELEEAHAAIWCAGPTVAKVFALPRARVLARSTSDNARATEAVGGSATRFRRVNRMVRKLMMLPTNTTAIAQVAADLMRERVLSGAAFSTHPYVQHVKRRVPAVQTT